MMIVELRISSVKTLIHCNHRSEMLSSGGMLLVTTQLQNVQGDLLIMTSRKLEDNFKRSLCIIKLCIFCFTYM